MALSAAIWPKSMVKSGEKCVLSVYNSFGSLGWIDTLPPEIRNEMDIFMGDVRDPNGVRTAMRGQNACSIWLP